MSVNLYQTGVSGLSAAQQQLATTGHNIANVNTEGYSRQRVEQNASTGTFAGNGNYIGSGTYVQDVTRVYNQFSYKEQLYSQSNLGYSDTLHKDLDQLNKIMSFSGESMGNSLDKFYHSMHSISDNPSDSALRSIALSQASLIVSDFRSLNDNIDQLEKSVNGEIQMMADKITGISFELAKVNDQILQSGGGNAQGQPNDLLDRRDQLITELGEYTSVNTVVDANGVMTVMIGGGSTLVAGITALSLTLQAGDPDPNQTTLRLASNNGQVEISNLSLGGALGAKFEFRDEHLTTLRSEVNRLAMAISDTLNEGQADGLDLNQQNGANLFTDINTTALMQGRVQNFSANTGSLAASVEITDVSLIPTDEFQIEYDGANYQMTNLSDGTTVNLGAAGAGTYTTVHGFDFNEDSGAPNAGDKLLLRPSENSASLMRVIMQNEDNIAASTPIGISASDNNISPGSVDVITMDDPAAARAYVNGTNSGLRVDAYLTGGNYTYRVYDAATSPIPNPPSVVGAITSGSFAPGSTAVIDFPPFPATMAFQIELSGDLTGNGALAPEIFTINDAFGVGNGGNATLMALTQEQGVLNGGGETFNQNISTSTAKVGSSAKSAELVADTAQALFTQAYNRNQATSGVNLDEEAANMMRFQQAYQASSKIISVANTLFDTILSAVR